ncbi:MAG: DNA-3-methyladenine glycosylase [Anaerolineae bacterium]
MSERIERAFCARATIEVARELLGCRLVRVLDGQHLSGIITETEAYVGEDDQASHASVGRTARNAVMYGPPGYAYVYLIYGIHHCLNVVTEREGFPAAVLIRALQPEEGIEIMRRHRPGRPDPELTNGPGKLCQALHIDRTLNGTDLVAGETLFIERSSPVEKTQIVATPRIGVRGDEAAINAPWRFEVTGYGMRDAGCGMRDTRAFSRFPHPASRRQKSNIILIGFSTTGKSRAGWILAQRLGWAFIDTDAWVAGMAGKSIPEIFEEEGELRFRELERLALEEALGRSQAVIASGGGAIVDKTNREQMRERGWIVLLDASPDTIIQRMQADDVASEVPVRPLLAGEDPLQRIIQLKTERQPLYDSLADISIHTDNLTIEAVVDSIINCLETLLDGEEDVNV